MQHYDVIVLGSGGVGTAAMYHAARRGLRVLGIDRFGIGHDRGSSHGHTRIIRQAYFEHADYVPLLRRAYELWHELESDCGEQLLHQVGLLQVGSGDGPVLSGVRGSAMQHGLKIEELTARDAERRFPAFVVPPEMQAIYEPTAGYLLVERCVAAHVGAALNHGAELRCDETVVAWRVEHGRAIVQTGRETYAADRLIVTAGAWANQLLGHLGLPLTVLRKEVFWWPLGPISTHATSAFADSGCPTFLYDLPAGCFYGFPAIDARGVKVAEHSGGELVADPLGVDRSVDPRQLSRVARFAGTYLRQIGKEHHGHDVCLYTMTPDGHFIVDRHPQHPRVALAAGLSGHGFKFAPVLGQILCELTIDGRSTLPIDFLSLTRFDKSTAV